LPAHDGGDAGIRGVAVQLARHSEHPPLQPRRFPPVERARGHPHREVPLSGGFVPVENPGRVGPAQPGRGIRGGQDLQRRGLTGMRRYYCDHNATTPLHPEAAAAVLAALGAGPGDPDAGREGTAGFGNPSSLHWAGREARNLVANAREALAGMLDVHPAEIIFTSGGTEADNLAILGSTASGRLRGRHLVAATFEHPAVLEPLRKLESEGWDVTWIDPDADGVVSSEAVAAALRPETGLVTVMAANNETGAIQPIAGIGAMLRPRGILFHCDGVQALGKIPGVRPRAWEVDYMAFSAHKINGPKGAGALYVRKGAPLQGLVLGGPQERRNRGGTENVPGIAGFGKAVGAWVRGGAEARDRRALLRDGRERALRARIPGL